MSPQLVLAGWFLALPLSASVAAGLLISPGDDWRYFRTASEIAQPPMRWQERGFDDGGWRSAPSGFVVPEDEPGVLRPAVPQSGRQFVRRHFRVADPGAIRSLTLFVEHEEGFTACLNGVEVARYRGPGVRFPSEAERAAGHEDAEVMPQVLDLTGRINLLSAGDNVLALEGPITGESVSPFTLAASMAANFTRGPFVMNASTNSIQIIWRTAGPASTFVEWGPTPALGNVITNAAFVTEHVVTLTGLAGGTTYYYRAGSDDGAGPMLSAIEPFRTLKVAGSIRFVAVGDTGQNSAAQGQVATVLRNASPDLVIHCGDIIYGAMTNAGIFDTRYFGYYQPHIKNTAYYLTVGNHDLGCCSGESPDWNLTNWVDNTTNYQNNFFLPTNSLTGTEHFYSFDHGDAHFVSLYNPWFAHFKFLTNSDQLSWLTNDLATSTKPWKFLFFHMPVANSGLHCCRDDNLNSQNDGVELIQFLAPLARHYGVQMIFTGHDHNFERFAPTNGVHYLVTGGGGGGVYQFNTRHAASAQFWAVNHASLITITGDTLRVEALTTSGAVFDTMVVHRALVPEAQVHPAAWASPTIETSPANNADGNITGQTFGLIGAPLLTRHGDFSNLGEFFVNNNATNLYLGVRNAMFYRDANLFVFVASPRLPGVATMAGLGNGVIDPAGQGADGLDCLENLSFTNFLPTVACVLGDEYADAQTRNFARAGLGLNIGQGVFRLNTTLSNIAGARIQQFNRSPETGPAPGEQNADLIEVAIPLRALGGVQPGERIQVAVVVGRAGFDAVAQTRELDSAVLGSFFAGSGQGPFVLGAATVQLAAYRTVDADGDTLLDDWEVAYGLNPAISTGDNGPDGDPDGDGMKNSHEQLAGTDPMDAGSVLRITLAREAPEQFRVTWPAVPGKRYRLEYASELTNFMDFTGPDWPRTATWTNDSYLDDLIATPPPPPQRTYRLRLE